MAYDRYHSHHKLESKLTGEIRVMDMLDERQMTKADEKMLQDGLDALGARIKPGPGPHIPDSVWKEACSGNFDTPGGDAQWDKVAEGVPGEVLDELLESYDEDRKPEELIMTIGAYIYGNFTADEILKYQLVFHDEWLSKGKSAAETLAALTSNIVLEAGEGTGLHNLEHVAGNLRFLKLSRLQRAASKVKLDPSGGKPAVIVTLLEYMYSDVLLPPPEARVETLADKAEMTLVHSLCKDSAKSNLQMAHAFGKKALKSACLGLVRESYMEFLVDPEIVAIVKEDEEDADFWGSLIRKAEGKCKRVAEDTASNETAKKQKK